MIVDSHARDAHAPLLRSCPREVERITTRNAIRLSGLPEPEIQK